MTYIFNTSDLSHWPDDTKSSSFTKQNFITLTQLLQYCFSYLKRNFRCDKTLNCQTPLDMVLEIKLKKSELRGCGINVLVKCSVFQWVLKPCNVYKIIMYFLNWKHKSAQSNVYSDILLMFVDMVAVSVSYCSYHFIQVSPVSQYLFPVSLVSCHLACIHHPNVAIHGLSQCCYAKVPCVHSGSLSP